MKTLKPDLRWLKRTKPNLSNRSRLKQISLLNFKAFGDWQNIKIRPLNLIFGKNSSGKSSIFHAFLWIRHVLLTENLNVYKPELGGDFVDLGGLGRYVHFTKKEKRKNKKFGFSFLVALPKEKLGDEITSNFLSRQGLASRNLQEKARNAWEEFFSLFCPRGAEIQARLEVLFDNFIIPEQKRFRFYRRLPELNFYIGDEKILNLKPKTNQIFEGPSHFEENFSPYYEVTCHSQVLVSHGIFKLDAIIDIFTNSISKKRQKPNVKKIVKETFAEIEPTSGSRVPRQKRFGGLRIYPRARNLARNIIFRPSILKHEKIKPKIKQDLLTKNLLQEFINEVSSEITALVVGFFRNVNYLAAYRKYPERDITEASLVNVMQGPYGEESFKDILNDPEMLTSLNRACQNLGADFRFGINQKSHSGRGLYIVHKNGHPLSFRDIGFGWSQVIPVLIELVQACGTTMRSGILTTLLVEQPELHLHPTTQSELMDVFLEHVASMEDSPIFLEVHSEQMVIRLLRRIKDGFFEKGDPKISPYQFAINYVLKVPEGSVIRELKISEVGTMLDPWPGGFFESALKDF